MGLPASLLFSILNLLTLVIVYAKVEGDLFFWSWTATLSPTLLSLFLIAIKNLTTLMFFNPGDLAGEEGPSGMKVHFIKCLFNIIFSVIAFAATILFAVIKEKSSPLVNNTHLFSLIGLSLVLHLIYSHWINAEMTKFLLPIAIQEQNKSFTNKITACFSALFAPVLNFLGASMVICSGGGCTTVYGSTISAILGAFGVSAAEFLPFLDWLTGILVLVSVFVVYRAKRDLKYPPFILTAVGAASIIINLVFLTSRYMVYAGNLMMIGAAIWNYKLNVPKLFSRKSKKAKEVV